MRKRLTKGRMNYIFRVRDIERPGFGPVVESLEIHTLVLVRQMRLGEDFLGIPIIRRHRDFSPTHELLPDGIQAVICFKVRTCYWEQRLEGVNGPTCSSGVTSCSSMV